MKSIESKGRVLTLPSPYYLDDDIQYHPSGAEFQYQQEVDHMNKITAERAANSQF